MSETTWTEYRAIWTNPYHQQDYQRTAPVREQSYEALWKVYPFNRSEEELPVLKGWEQRTVTVTEWETSDD